MVISKRKFFEANFYLAKLTCGLDKLKANTVIPADFTLDRYRTMQHEDSNTFILPVEDAFKSLPDDFPERHELLSHFHNIIQNLFPPPLAISPITKSMEIVTPKINNSNELKLVAVTKSSELVIIDTPKEKLLDAPKEKPLDEKHNKHEYRSRSRERREKEVSHSHGQHSSSHDDRTKDTKQKEKHSLHNRKRSRSRSRSRERDRNWSYDINYSRHYDSNYGGHYNSKRSRYY